MFKDLLRGDPDHPSDPANPEYITIAVAINRSDRRPEFFSFHVPSNADRSQGVFIAFTETSIGTMEEDCSSMAVEQSVPCFQIKLDPEEAFHLPFESCHEDSCVARVHEGKIEEGPDHPEIDLLQKFLSRNHILFLYTRDGEPFRAMEALFPFRRAYKQVMEKEFKSPSP